MMDSIAPSGGASPISAAVRTRTSGVRVWDLPTRTFHWLLLVCISGAVASALVGGNLMEWHMRFGAGSLGLLAFRVVWGLVGPRYARFRSFLYSPRLAFAYLTGMRKGAQQRHAGHSPSGALSVFAILGILLAQALSGLFSSDLISTDGPFVRHASEAMVSLASRVHVTLQWAIYALVALHVVVVIAYLLVKKDDLIGPMVHGNKYGIQAPDASDTPQVRVAGIALMAICVMTSLWLLRV